MKVNFWGSFLRNFLKEKGNGTIILTALPKLLVTCFWFLKAPSNRETCRNTEQEAATLLHQRDFKQLTTVQRLRILKSCHFKVQPQTSVQLESEQLVSCQAAHKQCTQLRTRVLPAGSGRDRHAVPQCRSVPGGAGKPLHSSLSPQVPHAGEAAAITPAKEMPQRDLR